MCSKLNIGLSETFVNKPGCALTVCGKGLEARMALLNWGLRASLLTF
jgi:hypothetical protein